MHSPRKLSLALLLALFLATPAFAQPDHSATANAVNAQFPHLLRANTHETDTEFLQRFIMAAPEAWDHISKSGGENGFTTPNGVRVSHDAVVHRASGRQVDIIRAAGSGQPTSPSWGPINPPYRPGNTPVRLCGAVAESSCAARIGAGGPVVTPNPEPEPTPVEPNQPVPQPDYSAALAAIRSELARLQTDINSLRNTLLDRLENVSAEVRDTRAHVQIVISQSEVVQTMLQTPPTYVGSTRAFGGSVTLTPRR